MCWPSKQVTRLEPCDLWRPIDDVCDDYDCYCNLATAGIMSCAGRALSPTLFNHAVDHSSCFET